MANLANFAQFHVQRRKSQDSFENLKQNTAIRKNPVERSCNSNRSITFNFNITLSRIQRLCGGHPIELEKNMGTNQSRRREGRE